MRILAVTAIGSDRPGIVAAVTGVIVELGGNLEDCSMSILRGEFAMVMIVAVPDGVAPDAVERSLVDATRALELVVAVRELPEAHPVETVGESWTVVVYGADKPGIVHRVATALALLRVNIVDLTTRVSDGDVPVYTMVMEVTLPVGLAAEVVRTRLSEVAAELDVECSLHASDTDVL